MSFGQKHTYWLQAHEAVGVQLNKNSRCGAELPIRVLAVCSLRALRVKAFAELYMLARASRSSAIAKEPSLLCVDPSGLSDLNLDPFELGGDRMPERWRH